MTPDQTRKLIGGFATRTLTDEERTALFEAALNDRGLFAELISEQAIQEVLDDPGSRAALLGALEVSKPARAWWKVWWVPASAIALTACLMVGVLLTWNATQALRVASVAREAPAKYAASLPAPSPASSKMLAPGARIPAAVVAPAPVPLAPPGPSSQMVEVQGQSTVALAAPMAAPAERKLKSSPSPGLLRLTLGQPAGVIYPGDDVSVMAIAESAGFLYVYDREGDGPWTSLGVPLEMTAGLSRLLPAIHIGDGVARVTVVAFLTSESGSPPDPDQIVPGRVKAELVLDVVEK